MASHYLSYWKPDMADLNISANKPLDHSAGEQLGKCKRGDVLWIVTVRSGELFLIGRITVGVITNQHQAEKLVGTHDLWGATHHVIALPGTAEMMTNVSLRSVVEELRFQSVRDRLTLKKGLVSPMQLQRVRKLTPSSAARIQTAWSAPRATGNTRKTR